MKTPEEIKKGQECCTPVSVGPRWKICSEKCPYWGIDYCKVELNCDTLRYIERLELYVGQVGEALCGKENATVCEVLDAVSQLKSRLAKAERERNAAVSDLAIFSNTPEICKHYAHCGSVTEDTFHGCLGTLDCSDYEWRGVCPENSKEDAQDENH